MSEELLISDAAKEVQVESHVLRYWEEELGLTIQRNEWGHRFYTREDVEKFKRIKDLKERGLQLKAIKMLMVAGRLEAFDRGSYEPWEGRGMAIEILEVRDAGELAVGAAVERMEVTAEQGEREEVMAEQGEREEVTAEEAERVEVTREQAERVDATKEKAAKTVVGEEAAMEGVLEEEIMPRRDETYFKKIDQLLRDKCFSPKKKRHFIF